MTFPFNFNLKSSKHIFYAKTFIEIHLQKHMYKQRRWESDGGVKDSVNVTEYRKNKENPQRFCSLKGDERKKGGKYL